MALKKRMLFVTVMLSLVFVAGVSVAAASQNKGLSSVKDGGVGETLVFSTPYYVIEVPTGLASYVNFQYQEGPSAEDIVSGNGRYATHATDVILKDDPTVSSQSVSFHVGCYADESRVDGPVLFADTGLTTPDGLEIGIQVARGTDSSSDSEAEELLRLAKECVKPLRGE